jgi:hypothetical protein
VPRRRWRLGDRSASGASVSRDKRAAAVPSAGKSRRLCWRGEVPSNSSHMPYEHVLIIDKSGKTWRFLQVGSARVADST